MRASVHVHVHVVVWKIVLFLQVHVQYQKATCAHVYNMYIVHVLLYHASTFSTYM